METWEGWFPAAAAYGLLVARARYKLHHDQDLFERAYGYVEQYH